MIHRARVVVGLILVVSLVPVIPAHALESSATNAFQLRWERTDLPVQHRHVYRTWMWGHRYSGVFPESYIEAPRGERLVQYFDKARMEITDPDADPDALWYVTTGLLAKELITGRMQVGEATYEDYAPARVNVAGDAGDPTGPTYATFNGLMAYAPSPHGWIIIQTVDRAGNVGADQSLARHDVAAIDVGAPTNHTVASVFWNFMNSSGLVYADGQYVDDQLFENPFYATGYPLTEAYWTTVRVGGAPKQVLVQVFERRVLTYTPDNPDGWQVEAGNVGQHYFRWRHHVHGPGHTYPVGKAPWDLAFDGSSIWVTDQQDNRVTKLRSSDGAVLGRFSVGAVGDRIIAVAVDDSSIWVVNHDADTVTKLRTSDGTVLGTFSVGDAPVDIAVDGTHVWVTNSGNDTVTKLRQSDGQPLDTFPVAFCPTCPNGVFPTGITTDGNYVYVVKTGTDSISKLRVSDGAAVGSFPVGDSPQRVAFDGTYLWVTNGGDGTVTKLRAHDGAVVQTIPVGSKPAGIHFDGTHVWVANTADRTVTKLRARDGTVIDTMAVGAAPQNVAFDGTNLWVVNANDGTVTKLPTLD